MAAAASRARGTPRVAGRLLRRVRDFAESDGTALIDRKAADAALRRLEVDEVGLDSLDRRYLRVLIEGFAGGPAGVETLAAAEGTLGMIAPRVQKLRRQLDSLDASKLH